MEELMRQANILAIAAGIPIQVYLLSNLVRLHESKDTLKEKMFLFLLNIFGATLSAHSMISCLLWLLENEILK